MNTHEAVSALARRAQRTARVWHVAGALIGTVAGLALGGALMGVAMATLGFIGGKVGGAAVAATTVAGLAVASSITRGLVRQHLALMRPRWIDELARAVGLNAEELASFFTLDSW